MHTHSPSSTLLALKMIVVGVKTHPQKAESFSSLISKLFVSSLPLPPSPSPSLSPPLPPPTSFSFCFNIVLSQIAKMPEIVTLCGICHPWPTNGYHFCSLSHFWSLNAQDCPGNEWGKEPLFLISLSSSLSISVYLLGLHIHCLFQSLQCPIKVQPHLTKEHMEASHDLAIFPKAHICLQHCLYTKTKPT